MDFQTDFRTIKNWFFENYMILNSEKCHYMCIKKTVQMIHFYTMAKFKNSREDTMLGVIIDNN